MRMLIGVEWSEIPTLLVNVTRFIDSNNFRFHVINGGWNGSVVNGLVNVSGQRTQQKVKIFSDNEDFLYNLSYDEVFLKYADDKKGQ